MTTLSCMYVHFKKFMNKNLKSERKTCIAVQVQYMYIHSFSGMANNTKWVDRDTA